MRKTTNIDLPEELEKRDAEKYSPIIVKARMNVYHDFKSQETCGKMTLAADLNFYPELADIRTDVINGVYDESPDFHDCIQMRSELLEGEQENDANRPLLSEMGFTEEQLRNRFPEEAIKYFSQP